MDKRGIELAVNTIVILVLMMAMFGVGIWLATTIFTQGQEAINLQNEALKDQYANLACGGGQTICISDKSVDLGFGEEKVIAVRITNRLQDVHTYKLSDAESRIDFPDTIDIGEESPASSLPFSALDTPPSGGGAESPLTVRYLPLNQELRKGEETTHLLALSLEENAVPGTYVVTLTYQYSVPSDGYDDLPAQKIFINVR